jgi:hypothetical protein
MRSLFARPAEFFTRSPQQPSSRLGRPISMLIIPAWHSEVILKLFPAVTELPELTALDMYF